MKSPAPRPTMQMLQLGDLHDTQPPGDNLVETINPLHQVKATLQVCVGEATLTVGELLEAKENHVIALDRRVEEPVDLLLEGRVIARGHLVAVGEHFAVRISELPIALKV